jgi:hypothetical protein
MVDGPFVGFHASFNSTPAGSATGGSDVVVFEADDTDLGSSALASMTPVGLFAGLVSLLGLRRFGKRKN